MRRKSPEQVEMFSSTDSVLESESRKLFSFINLRNHERAILLIICFLIVGIISFSLGVNKGRKQSISRQEEKAEIKPQLKQEEIRTIKEKEDIGLKITDSEAKYTIQVATFRTKTYAEKEAGELTKKGLEPLVLPKGKYVQLCVGEFSNKDEAKETLKKLKKRYQDCFVRRL